MCEMRRAVCVALALVCVMMICSSAAWGVYERNFVNPEDFADGLCDNVSFTMEQGGLHLNECMMSVPFLWVPSPTTNMISRIDARTGVETARYKIGPSSENWIPCAVATDPNGNAYVACICPDSTGKVVRIAASGGTDANNDGHITTSGDFDSNNQITPIEVMAWGHDECVGPVYEVGSEDSRPSGIAFDSQGFLWVILRGEAKVAKINPKSGKVIALVDTDGWPSSIVAGDRGYMWILSREQGTISQINTISCTLTASFNLDNCVPAGICTDENGRLWIADLDGGLIDFDTENCTWEKHEVDGESGFSSVVLDKNGDVWAACPSAGYVVCFSGHDETLMAQIPVGNEPTSLSIDVDGYLWVLCGRSGSAVKIDTQSEQRLAVVNTDVPFYCTTPFTACSTKKGVCPKGMWRMLVDSKIQGAGWGRINWDSLEVGGGISVQARTSDSPDLLNAAQYANVTNGKKFTVPEGRFMEVLITLNGDGRVSPVLRGLHIEGVNLAPKVDKAVPMPAKILRTDHMMESVCIEGVYDPEGDEFSIQITGVKQDEPVIGFGPDDCSPDAICMGGSSVWLRGECDPGTKEKPADGRVYVVSFRAVDEFGAESLGNVKVMVPTTSDNETAVENLAKYDSYKEPPKTVCSNLSPDSPRNAYCE